MAADLQSTQVNEEQVLYAKILEIGMYIGLLLLLVTFALYVSGVIAPAVPVEDLPKYWTLNVHDYLEAVNADHLHREHAVTGWAWLSALENGDYLTYLGIALLSAVTIVCYLGIVPTLVRKGDTAYVVMALLEVMILTLAASGILAAGH